MLAALARQSQESRRTLPGVLELLGNAEEVAAARNHGLAPAGAPDGTQAMDEDAAQPAAEGARVAGVVELRQILDQDGVTGRANACCGD